MWKYISSIYKSFFRIIKPNNEKSPVSLSQFPELKHSSNSSSSVAFLSIFKAAYKVTPILYCIPGVQ